MSEGNDRVRRVRDAYTAAASAYERLWAPALRRITVDLVASMPLAGAERVLDAACGVGTLLDDLQAAATRAEVIGVDLSEGMLRRAPARFSRVAADLRRLPLRDRSIDAALGAFVLFHLADPSEALRELARVVRPGGMLGTITWEGEPDFPAHRVWAEELERSGAAPLEPLAGHTGIDTPEGIVRLFTDAGFAPPEVCLQPIDFVFTSETLFELRTNMGCSGRRFASLTADGQARLREAVLERFRSLAPEDFVDHSRAILAWGTRGEHQT